MRFTSWAKQIVVYYLKSNCCSRKVKAFLFGLRKDNYWKVTQTTNENKSCAYSEPYQAFKMESFAKTVNSLKLKAVRSILDV